jgi:hypothetical protein
METKAQRMTRDVKVILGMSGEEFRNAVLRNAEPLSFQRDLPEDARARIAEVVRDAWPAAGVRTNVEREENRIRFKDLGAYAWLTLAPALDIAPSPEQWADLATSGAILTDTSSWLERHYSEGAALIAAQSCDSTSLRPWAQLVGAIPNDTRVPDEVVEALLTQVSEMTPKEAEIELWTIGDRFMREARLDAMQALSRKSNEFDVALRPWRSRLGETEAARILLDGLIANLSAGKRFDRDEAEWLEGVNDKELLKPLFDALALAIRSEDDSPFGVSGALGRAIYRVGGDEAVRMYDELIDNSDESRFKFLRLQRDEIVQAELRRTGQASAVDVTARLELATLDSDDGAPD